MEKPRLKRNVVVFLALFISLFSLKFPVLRLPHFWDGISNVLQAGLIYSGSLSEYVRNVYHGHPPLFALMIAGVWEVFGASLVVNHVLGLMLAFLALCYTFLLGQRIAGSLVGAVSAVLLLFSPMFFAQSGILNYAIPLTAFLVMTVYYFYSGNLLMYAVFGSCLVMTKEPGVLVILGVLIYLGIVWVKDRSKDNLKRVGVAFLPLIVYGCWLIYHKFTAGWFLVPEGMGWEAASSFTRAKLSFLAILRHFLVDDERWILLFFIVLAFCRGRSIRKNGPWGLLFFLIMALQVLFFTFFQDFTLIRYLLPVYPLYYLIGAYCLAGALGERPLVVWGVVGLLIVCSVMNWDLDRDFKGPESGAALQSNMEYADVVRSHQAACRYIEEHYPLATVLVGWPENKELGYPELGYVSRKIETLRFNPGHAKPRAKDFDLVYCADHAGEDIFLCDEAQEDFILLKEFDVGGRKSFVYQSRP